MSDTASSESDGPQGAAEAPARSRPLTIAFALGIAVLVLTILYLGKDFLIPVAIAIVIWYLINAVSSALQRLPGANKLPRWPFLFFSLLIITTAVYFVGRLIGANVAEMADTYPQYRDNLIALAERVSVEWGIPIRESVENFFEEFDFRPWISGLATGLTTIIGTTGLILVYVLFMLVEQTRFDRKLEAVFRDPSTLTTVRIVLRRMQRQIETYVWVKTFTSALTGLCTYLVLIFVGVDYAPFWALMTFLLNFIPTIGSTLSVIFPALMTLVQFDTLTPFLITVPLLTTIQASIGNFLEPPLMGQSLNISPLVVMLSLVLWGTLWGLTGMFLCVPIMVILMIVLAQFRPTRPVAVMLSASGRV